MANTDGKKWSNARVKRIGAALKAARGARSAKWLSDRTAELGYPISRTVIAKLDTGHRGDALSVTELLVLAAALEVPPALLLFPEFPDGPLDLLPDDRQTNGYEAVKWFYGEQPLPPRRVDRERGITESPVNVGTQLVAAVRERDRLAYENLRTKANRDATAEERAEAATQVDQSGAKIDYIRDQLGICAAAEQAIAASE